MKADLHIHTTASDGSDTIDRIIGKAKEKGLDAIALTDHDTMSHLPQIPADAGIKIIHGVEISAIHRDTNTRTDILGYNIRKPEIIERLTRPLLEARNRNSEKQADLLRQRGFHIDMEKIPKADGKYLYKEHIMGWLVMTGQASDLYGDFYQRTFEQGGAFALDLDYIDVFMAIKAIKAAGGLAVLAHPGRQRNFHLIPKLAKAGLDGLEFNHHANSEKDRETLWNHANRYGLFLTGGSDYHGQYDEPQSFGFVGALLSEESGVKAIC